MRVIAGKYKGHPLLSFQAAHIRPTTDRVKETLFNVLPYTMEGAFVLDLFCGTGNLGIEALSRGARMVVFVDEQPSSLKITQSNLQRLGIPVASYRVVQNSAFMFLKQYSDSPFDVILADPPFTEKIAHVVMESVQQSQAFGEETVVAIESERRERMDDKYGSLERYTYREFGDKILSLFRRGNLEAPKDC